MKEETSQGKMIDTTLTELSLRCQGASKDSFYPQRGPELSLYDDEDTRSITLPAAKKTLPVGGIALKKQRKESIYISFCRRKNQRLSIM